MLRVGTTLLRNIFSCSSHKTSSPPLHQLIISASSHSGQHISDVPYESYKADEGTLAENAPDNADVVVMGGGVIGCSTLYHLAKMGVTNAVLVEKDQLTAGTTWHTAGLVWRFRPNDVDIQVITRSHELMTNLEDETGVNTGWINNGGIYVASNKERLEEFKRLHTIGNAFGIESHILGPEETKILYPHLNVADVYGSVYCPIDGTIDPAGYCTALSRGATRRGAQILQNCSVTGIDVQKDDFGLPKVQAVHTERGTIKTKCVVNCAGAWAPYLGAMAGVKIPLITMKHGYVVTERIEGIQNMPNLRDHDLTLYVKLQGDTLQIGGFEPNPIFVEPSVPKDFAFSLYEFDWNVFGIFVEGAIHRIPIIEHTGIRSTVCGPESFTPDHKPLLGESPEVRGYYLGCGLNSLGMSLSGCGEQLAKWIINGRPDLDMYSYDICRFTEKLTDNKRWIRERSHEIFAKNYSIIYFKDQPLAARNQRCDPLFESLLTEGCVYEEKHGWERPSWFARDQGNAVLEYDYYGSYDYKPHVDYKYRDKLALEYTFGFPQHHEIVGNECFTCRNKVAVFNMTSFGKYYIHGPDAQAAVDWLFTNDMQKEYGTTVYTCMLNHRGGTELDLTASVLEPGNGKVYSPHFEGAGFYINVGGGAAQHAYSYIQRVLQDQKFHCSINDCSEDMCLISVQGPHSRNLLQSIIDCDLSNESFPFLTHQIVSILDEYECRALRVSFVGELGWELHVPNSTAVDVYKAVMEAGKKWGVVNAGFQAIDSLSIEKGYRHWHADLRPDDTPLESMLEFACKPLDGSTDFIGRSVLQFQKKEGIKKRLVCFTLDEPVALQSLETIWRNEEAVGHIRRAEFAFTLNKPIAYGYISRPDGLPVHANYLKDASYKLEHFGKLIPAKIHLKSPFDSSNKRVKGIYM